MFQNSRQEIKGKRKQNILGEIVHQNAENDEKAKVYQHYIIPRKHIKINEGTDNEINNPLPLSHP
jgi:hypothetical protein